MDYRIGIIKNIIADVLSNDDLNMDEYTSFDGIGMDDLDRVDLILNLEDTFNFDFRDEFIPNSINDILKELDYNNVVDVSNINFENRVIKFKAYDNVKGMTDCFCIHASGLIAYKNNEWLKNNEKPTLLQFTGYVDKNDKELYDHYLVHYQHPSLDCLLIIIWDDDNCYFVFMDEHGEKWHMNKNEVMQYCTYVGNLYENSDLWKGDK